MALIDIKNPTHPSDASRMLYKGSVNCKIKKNNAAVTVQILFWVNTME